jgi:uncharacterized protein (TIGR02266 family)
MFTLVSEEAYSDGQVIFNEDSSGDWVYVVISGSVEIYKVINEKKYVIEVLGEGEIFGELGFIGGIKRTASVRSIGETTVGVINRDTLDQEFNKLSTEFRLILIAIIKRFKKMVDRVSGFSARSDPRLLKTLSISYKDKQSFLNAYTSNISNGGLFISTGSPLAQDDVFLLKLQLPELSQPLKIKCKVAWVNKQESGTDNRPPGMGVQFTEMNSEDKKTLSEYIHSLMKT